MKSIRKNALRVAAATVATGLIGIGGVGLAGAASASTTPASYASGYRFQTLDNAHDVTFNQLLGINDEGLIAGYFGSGAAGHPNQGYQLHAPYYQDDYRSENFPGSVQTQVTGLNNRGVTVGFWSSMNTASMVNNNFGFAEYNGTFHNENFPTGNPDSPPVDQLLGVNDEGIAVGFYTDGAGTNHGYAVDIWTHRFTPITDPEAPGTSLTAAAINDYGQVAGLYTNPANGTTDGFYLHGRHFTDLAVPGASSTQALGLNNRGEVVGFYTVGTGSSAVTHGFTWTARHGFRTVDDPNGIGTTTVNGVNDRGQLVGFYTDAAGNTDGMLATPQS
jgi:hypothetical protein